MDDNNIIYYLILGGIYLLSRLLKKKKPQVVTPPRPDRRQQQQPTQQHVPSKPVSFEDILKELSREMTPEDQRQPKEIEVEEEPIRVEPKVVPKEELTREQQYVKKRHEQMEREHKLALEKAKAEEREAHEPHAVLELLNEEGGAANAIILSEILNRKY